MIMKERTLWPIVLGIATLVGITIGVSRCTHKNDELTEDHERERHFDDSVQNAEIMESVYDRIFQLRLDHPDIVMAQCILESGEFTSDLFKEGNNCLGMKVPGQRPTFAVGVCRGHARFKSWHDCIADYALWQSAYGRGLSDDAYLALLDRIYAEDGSYTAKLKSIIRKYNL